FQVNPESILQLRVLSGQGNAEKQEKGDAVEFHFISIHDGGTNIHKKSVKQLPCLTDLILSEGTVIY
ncbi:MAG TPA: hypothetical protein DDZ57_08075, partial [Porphyromonadaceae bacterium]|nr:hypothetical protein [Porphyromonadaceae bacterium]